MKAFFMLGFTLLLLSCNQLSAQAKFYITAPKSVPVNQNFQINVVLENGNCVEFRAPEFSGLQVSGGPFISKSFQWVNNKVVESCTYSYMLKTGKPGLFRIGKAIVNASGLYLESNAVDVRATNGVSVVKTL